MSSQRLAGFLTRPEASKIYNRSQRALERDLDIALTTGDQDLLSHWKLVTKDETVRDASDVSVEEVKALQKSGMIPVWFVEQTYLEEEYGRRGESMPARTKSTEPKQAGPANPEPPPSVEPQPASSKTTDLPDNVDFLKERIRILEQEHREEKARHDEILGKVFDQLHVKDEQIKKWDEVTQALIKGLATGQLALADPHAPPQAKPHQSSAQATEVIDAAIPEQDAAPKPARKTPQPRRKSSKSSRKKAAGNATKRNIKKQSRKRSGFLAPIDQSPTLNTLNRLLRRTK